MNADNPTDSGSDLSQDGSNVVRASAVGRQSTPMSGVPTIGSQPELAVQGGTSYVTPQVADDGDLIEKEWVEAVRRVMAGNKSDPYAQSKAMTVLRQDYLRKRYNKSIKIAD